MIKFECTDVWGFYHTIRGMRNPLNSWDKSDSDFCYAMPIECSECNNYDKYENECKFKYLLEPEYYIGQKDMELCHRLISGGSEHRKFLRQIMVSVDITAPLYWWKEFDTYKVGTVANSCSTMHTIHKKEFDLLDFSFEKIPGQFEEESRLMTFTNKDICFQGDPDEEYSCADMMLMIIGALNKARELYLETKNKKYWYTMIQLLPSSYNQKRTVTMNYENLRSMYFQRRNHKLDEWREGFCKWVKSLPYADELIIFEETTSKD